MRPVCAGERCRYAGPAIVAGYSCYQRIVIQQEGQTIVAAADVPDHPVGARRLAGFYPAGDRTLTIGFLQEAARIGNGDILIRTIQLNRSSAFHLGGRIKDGAVGRRQRMVITTAVIDVIVELPLSLHIAAGKGRLTIDIYRSHLIIIGGAAR